MVTVFVIICSLMHFYIIKPSLLLVAKLALSLHLGETITIPFSQKVQKEENGSALKMPLDVIAAVAQSRTSS